MADRYRALYPASRSTHARPPRRGRGDRRRTAAGGRDRRRHRKYAPNAQLHLDQLGLNADAVEGWRWAEAKGEALVEHGASVTSATTRDIAGARAAGAVAVGVSTGGVDGGRARGGGRRRGARLPRRLPRVARGAPPDRPAGGAGRPPPRLGSVVVAFSGGADSPSCWPPPSAPRSPTRWSPRPRCPTPWRPGARGRGGLRRRARGPPPHPAHVRDGSRGLPRQRRGPLLLLQGRAARRAPSGRRPAGPCAPSRRGPTPTTRVAGFRPGIRAADERGAVTPLRDAGLTKAQIREASRRWGLVTWDKPQAACLSSRVAYGIEITPTGSRASTAPRRRSGWRSDTACIDVHDLRVRDLGRRARIEVDADQVEAVLADPAVPEAVLEAGFDEVGHRPPGVPQRIDERALTPRAGLG